MTTGGETHLEPPRGRLREQALRGVLWAAVEKWSVRLSTLVGFIVLGNLLSAREFGLVALAMTFINILSLVADAGFSSYLLQQRKLTETAASTAFYTTSALAFVLSAALAASAGPIGAALDAPGLRTVLPALAVSLMVAGLSSVPAMLLRRDLRFKELAVRQVSANVISVAVAVGLALAGAGVWALVAQTLVRNLVALVVLWRTSDFRPRWGFHRAEARAMSAYGVQSLMVQLGNQLRNQGEVFLIGALAGTVAVGYWTVAGRLVGVLVDVCTSVVGAVAQPVFARLQGDSQRLARALGTAMAMGGLITVPVLIGLSLVSRQVVPAVFGHQWAPAAGVATWLALRSLVRALSDFGRSALMATGHPSAELVTTVSLLVVQLGLVVLFHDDLLVLAVALTGGMALSIPIRMVLLRRLHGVRLTTYAQVTSVLLAGGTSAGAVLAVQSVLHLDGLVYVVVVLLLGGAVYLGTTLLVARPLVTEVVTSVRSALGQRRTRAA